MEQVKYGVAAYFRHGCLVPWKWRRTLHQRQVLMEDLAATNETKTSLPPLCVHFLKKDSRQEVAANF